MNSIRSGRYPVGDSGRSGCRKGGSKNKRWFVKGTAHSLNGDRTSGHGTHGFYGPPVPPRLTVSGLFANCTVSLRKILQHIFDMFRTHGQANRVEFDPLLRHFFRAQWLCVADAG